jgi:hypothetical protein
MKVENVDNHYFTSELKHAGPTCSTFPYKPAALPFRARDVAIAFYVKKQSS